MPLTPVTRAEHFMAKAAGDSSTALSPITREEFFLNEIANAVSASGGGGTGDGVSITVDTTMSESSQNPVQNRAITAALLGKMDSPTIESVTGASITITPETNTIYRCDTLVALTLSNPTPSGAYSVFFTSGNTATVTTFPATLLGLEQFAADANRIYEINVLDNRAVVGSWAVGSS